jgi:hypothetical protein
MERVWQSPAGSTAAPWDRIGVVARVVPRLLIADFCELFADSWAVRRLVDLGGAGRPAGQPRAVWVRHQGLEPRTR